MSNRQALLVCLALFALLLSHQPAKTRQSRTDNSGRPELGAETSRSPLPPAPPIRENFDGRPQLSLFPRLGDFRPEEDDRERLPYWRNYLLHLQKISGVTAPDSATGNRVFSFRNIKGLAAVGYFSPLKVSAGTTYRVAFKIKAELPEGGSAGVGIIEFDRFLWLAEQYPQSLDDQHRTGVHAGFKLSASSDWIERSFTFTTGPDSGMIHLTLFREGAANRQPVLLDDISIEKME
jgi:hypothetical protein